VSIRVGALLFALLISLMVALVPTTCQPPTASPELSNRILIEPSELMNHVRALASLGSRVTGYEGCKRAAEYIASVLRSYGLKVMIHKYSAVVPIDEGSSVTVIVNGHEYTFTAYSVWPNGVNPSPTPPGGVKGPLIYVGRGRLEDFDGKTVDGAIVLMDYESGDNWLNAVKLGAKAVIFTGPSHVPPYVESLKKFLDTPINFPRVYVTHEVGERLKELAKMGAEAVVVSRMRWKEIEAENIVGILKGEIPDTILLTTHYDSWSAVPALASSAHEAIAPAYLLELARALSQARPYHTVWFVFFSGHWEALVGPREFVERFYFGPELENGSFKPVMLINIGDLDPEGTGLQLLRGGAGTLYATTSNAGGITLRYAWVVKKIFTEYLMDPELRKEIKDLVGVEPSTYVRDYFTNGMYWGTEQFPYMLDSEPAEMTRGVAFTIQSAYASKQWLGSPVSDLEELSEEKLELLRPQLIVMTHLITSFINERDWGIKWNEVSPARIYILPGGFSQYAGFITLKGRVVTYNLSVGWYRPCPHALVRVYVGLQSGGVYFPFPYPFNKMITFADENGEFEVHGLAPYPFIPGAGAAGGGLVRSMYVADAWIINETTGEIEYAPNLGIYGAKALPPRVSPLTHPEHITVVINRFYSITLLDLVNPKEGRPAIIPDPRVVAYGGSPNWFFGMGGVLMTQDFDAKGDPLFYGVYYNGYETAGITFFMPKSRAAVILRIGGLARPAGGRPVMVLVNASEEWPEGRGITKSILLRLPAFRYAKDLLLMTKHRYEKLRTRGIRCLSVEEKLKLAEELLKNATQLLREKRYSEAYPLALAAWSVAEGAYEEVMPLIEDSSKTSLFFFALIIPAALFLERLTLHMEGRRRVLSTLVIGSALIAAFALVHPALHVMMNSIMAVLGMLAFLLFVMTMGVLVDETQKVLREISYKILGFHVVETGRLGIASASFTVALENMRRRKLRTMLTFITLTAIALAVTSLTSVSSYVTVKAVTVPYRPVYEGMLIKSGYGTPPQDVYHPMLVELVRGILGNEVHILPRAWYYPPSIGPNVGVMALVTTRSAMAKNVTYRVMAALGMTPEDVKLTLGRYMTPGSRPFFEDELMACIIPDTMAKVLNVTIGDHVLFQGLRLLVVGVYNASLLQLDVNATRDLDGMPVAPIDPHYVQQLGLGVLVPTQQVPPPVAWSSLIILPYELALRIGGYVAMISVRFPPGISIDEVLRRARILSLTLDVPSYTSIGGKVIRMSKYPTFAVMGWEVVPVILIIGALNVAVTLLGNVRERVRDIFVYSAIGLSPMGAMIMFLIESMVYASLSILVGYYLGFALNNAFLSLGILPSYFTFNYASIFAVISLLILLLSALVSSLYPARIAAAMITPSLERRWKPPTKPRGRIWELPLPLSLPSLEEAMGLIEFLREYYEGAGAQKPTFTIRSIESVSYEPPSIVMRVALAPYEMGIVQSVKIEAIYSETEKRYALLATLQHETGPEKLWANFSYYFVDDLRKQLLLWRSLSAEEHRKYFRRAKERAR